MGSDLPKGARSSSILTWTQGAGVCDVAHKAFLMSAALSSVMLQWFHSTEVSAERPYTKALVCAERQETEELMKEEERWCTQRRIQLQADYQRVPWQLRCRARRWWMSPVQGQGAQQSPCKQKLNHRKEAALTTGWVLLKRDLSQP